MFQPQPTPLVAAAAASAAPSSAVSPNVNNSTYPSPISFSNFVSSQPLLSSHSFGANPISSSALSAYNSCGLSTTPPHQPIVAPSVTSRGSNSFDDALLEYLNPVNHSTFGSSPESSSARGGSVNTANGAAISAAGSVHPERRYTIPRLSPAKNAGSYRGASRNLAKLPVTEVIGYRTGVGNGSALAYTASNSTRTAQKAPRAGTFSPSFPHIPAHRVYPQPQQPVWVNSAYTRLQSSQLLSGVVEMDDQDQHSLAAQEAAARAYEPSLEGPLVGDKQSSEAITQQYAKADPVYIEKTILLPQTYSHYRPIQGDGNCGWRAIGFLYCEKLIELGDKERIDSEIERHEGMKQALDDGSGFLEDFVDAMVTLLKAISDTIHEPPTAQKVLLENFNDADLANPIIYYLRILAAQYFKSNAAEYDAFVIGTGQGSGVIEFCQRNIEPVNMEIEQMGITALTNNLLKPVNIILEIAYLDRSPGTETNTYRYPDDTKDRELLPHESLICLLYRPDHYDILYRAGSYGTRAPSEPISVEIHRAANFSDNSNVMQSLPSPPSRADSNVFATGAPSVFSTLSILPGMNSMDSPMSMNSSTSGVSLNEHFGQPRLHHNQWVPLYENIVTASPHPPPIVAPASPPYQTLAIRSQSSQASLQSSAIDQDPNMHLMGRQEGLLSSGSEYTIRFSPMQYQYRKGSYPEPTFQVTTSTFKNSVWNRAHFGNPDFHPEEYNPDEGPADQRRRRN